MAKKLTLSQKSIGCGFMVQNHEAIYTEDVKESVLEFENWLKQYYDEKEEFEVMAYSEVFHKFREIFGEF